MAPCGGVEGVEGVEGVDSGGVVDVVDVHEGDDEVGGDIASPSSWWKGGVWGSWTVRLPMPRMLLPPLPVRNENRDGKSLVLRRRFG